MTTADLQNVEIPRDQWRIYGICTQTDPALFYPEEGNQNAAAKRICKECPVQTQCLAEALEHDEAFGIWGGYTPRERLRLKHGLPARPEAPVTLYSEVARTDPDGHGYTGYRRGCRCSKCRAGNAAMQRAYQTASRSMPRLCQTCGAEVSGRGKHRYCSTECRKSAQARKRAA